MYGSAPHVVASAQLKAGQFSKYRILVRVFVLQRRATIPPLQEQLQTGRRERSLRLSKPVRINIESVHPTLYLLARFAH